MRQDRCGKYVELTWVFDALDLVETAKTFEVRLHKRLDIHVLVVIKMSSLDESKVYAVERVRIVALLLPFRRLDDDTFGIVAADSAAVVCQ